MREERTRPGQGPDVRGRRASPGADRELRGSGSERLRAERGRWEAGHGPCTPEG